MSEAVDENALFAAFRGYDKRPGYSKLERLRDAIEAYEVARADRSRTAYEEAAKVADEIANGLNVTDEELLRIRNKCEGNDYDTKIWARMLQMLVDHIRRLRSLAIREGE